MFASAMLLKIQLDLPYGHTVVVPCTEYELPQVPVLGCVEVTLALPLASVRAVLLRLVGEFRSRFDTTVEKRFSSRLLISKHGGSVAKVPVTHRDSRPIVEVAWVNLLTDPTGVCVVGNYGDDTDLSAGSLWTDDTASSVLSVETPSHLLQPTTASTTPFPDVHEPGASFAFPLGTFRLPFRCVLPATAPALVEGLGDALIQYRLEAKVVVPSLFSKTRAHQALRVFRTLLPGLLALLDELMVDRTWKGKVQYRVKLPQRAVPIGATTTTELVLLPTTKPLKLHLVTVLLVQYHLVAGPLGKPHVGSMTLFTRVLPIDVSLLPPDIWRIECGVSIPNNLSHVVPHIDHPLMTVHHKLHYTIRLDKGLGFSEARVALPIVLYVLPECDVVARPHLINSSGKWSIGKLPVAVFGEEVHVEGGIHVQLTEPPPEYALHVYDQLYTPATTAAGTPASGMARLVIDGGEEMQAMEIDMAELVAGLCRVPSYGEPSTMLPEAPRYLAET